jgi:hypothetical protein
VFYNTRQAFWGGFMLSSGLLGYAAGIFVQGIIHT